jgi:diaminohydroxyphosphoribosylaminopyrimidine deaminase/5-amino-6-(5-phosphoribosylamino)uracil reductase
MTDGRSLARLRRAGIAVTTGVLAREAAALNEPFFRAMTSRLPVVIAKLGQSLDGKIATRTGESRWITSPAARRMGHRWRGRVDAVLVGVTTVRRDDPRLTARGVPHRRDRPIKVIVDSRLRIPLNARCLSSRSPTPSIVATTIRRGPTYRALLRRGVEVVTVPSRRGRVALAPLFRWLIRRGIHSVLIEGGGEVVAGALAEQLVNRVVLFMAPMLIGGERSPGTVGGAGAARLSQAVRLADVRWTRVGPDACVEARVVYPGRRGA